MRRVKVYLDIQNVRPHQFVLVVDGTLTTIGDRDSIIHELRNLHSLGYFTGTQFQELLDAIRGR